jgi:hypothetical protein
MPKHVKSETKLEYVSPDLLDFDPDNPRFAGRFRGYPPDRIQKEISEEPFYALELVDSLVENGFIDYEPLVVKRNGKRFTVIEGNRRLAAIREIRANPDHYAGRKSDLDAIPVLIFPERPDEQQSNEMRVYLGVRHLFGFRDWPPLSKAQYLDRESEREGGLDRVLQETQLKKNQARRFLVPFRLLTSADLKIPDSEDFWVLGEALARAGIKKFLQLEIDPKTLKVLDFNKRNLNLLLTDLYGPKKAGARDPSGKIVFDTRDLSRLANVLSSEKATEVLHASKNIGEAEIYVDTWEQSVTRLTKVMKEMRVLIKKVLRHRNGAENRQLGDSFRRFDTAVKDFVKKYVE